MSLIDALVFLRSAWNDVTQDTIRNCFNKAFDLETSEIEHHDPAWSNAEEIWEQSCLEGLDLEGVTFSDYVNIDRDLPVSAVPTDKDIIDEINNTNNSDDEDLLQNQMKMKFARLRPPGLRRRMP